MSFKNILGAPVTLLAIVPAAIATNQLHGWQNIACGSFAVIMLFTGFYMMFSE